MKHKDEIKKKTANPEKTRTKLIKTKTKTHSQRSPSLGVGSVGRGVLSTLFNVAQRCLKHKKLVFETKKIKKKQCMHTHAYTNIHIHLHTYKYIRRPLPSVKRAGQATSNKKHGLIVNYASTYSP